MTFYIDIILLENVMMNYIILLATAIICKIKIKHLYILLASFIGASCAIAFYLFKELIHINIVGTLFLSGLMLYVAFKPSNLKNFLKQCIIFYLTSFCFGGVAYYLLHGTRLGLMQKINRSFNRRIPYKNSNYGRNYRIFFTNYFF